MVCGGLKRGAVVFSGCDGVFWVFFWFCKSGGLVVLSGEPDDFPVVPTGVAGRLGGCKTGFAFPGGKCECELGEFAGPFARSHVRCEGFEFAEVTVVAADGDFLGGLAIAGGGDNFAEGVVHGVWWVKDGGCRFFRAVCLLFFEWLRGSSFSLMKAGRAVFSGQ